MSATLIDQAMPPGPGEPAQPAMGPRSEVKSMAWRLKHCAAPPATVAAIACAGALGQLGVQAAGVTAGMYIVVAVFLWLRAERHAAKEGNRSGRRYRLRRRYRIVVSSLGLVWIAWADATSAGGWRAVTLLVGGYALASLGVLLFGSKIPNPAEPKTHTPPAVAEVVDSQATRLVHDWNRFVACDKGRLPGSEIRPEDAVDTATGARATLRLVRGQQSIDSVDQCLPVIRTALGYGDITVEPHPSTDPALVILTVVAKDKSATREEIPWAGPALDLKTGLIDIGPYTDGEGVAFWKLITENGLHGGLIVGDKDSGKSGLTLNVALSAASSGVISVNVADPDDGASQPELAKWAHLSAKGLEQIDALLWMLRAGAEFRLMENAAEGWAGWDPFTQGRPGVLTVIHECHKAFAVKSIRENAEFLDRHCRKVGIALIAETQDSRVQAFGDSDPLRSSMASSNYFATHTQSYNSKDTIPGLKGDPTKLPKEPGYAYGSHGCRRQMLRARHVRADQGWTERIRNVAPDDAFINAMGVPYQEWQARVAELDEWRMQHVQAIREGRTPPPRPEAKPVERAAPAVGEGTTGPERMGTLLDFQAPRLVGTGPRKPASKKVLQALAAGHVTTSTLVAATGLTDTTIRKECTALVERGLLLPKMSKQDPWCLTPDGYAAARQVAS